jgi:hypothetical protein
MAGKALWIRMCDVIYEYFQCFRSDLKKYENNGIPADDSSLMLEDQDRARVSRLFYLQLYSSVLNAEKREVEERLQTRAQQQKNLEQTEVMGSFIFAVLLFLALQHLGGRGGVVYATLASA